MGRRLTAVTRLSVQYNRVIASPTSYNLPARSNYFIVLWTPSLDLLDPDPWIGTSFLPFSVLQGFYGLPIMRTSSNPYGTDPGFPGSWRSFSYITLPLPPIQYLVVHDITELTIPPLKFPLNSLPFDRITSWYCPNIALACFRKRPTYLFQPVQNLIKSVEKIYHNSHTLWCATHEQV